jgi:NADH-quinone oxidoreductase subunit N
MAGLAGLPPGLAGLFAKVTVVRALLDGSAGWLAVVVGVNAVIGLAYYARLAALTFAAPVAPAVPAAAPAALVAEPVPAVAAVAAPAPAPGAVVDEGALHPAPVPSTAPSSTEPGGLPALAWPVGVTLAVVSVAAVVAGFAPQLVLDASRIFADLWS